MKKLPRLTWEEGMVLNQLFTDYTKVSKEMQSLIKPALAKNKKLVRLYLRQKEFDVYFACSLRSKEDFECAEKVCREIEKKVPGIKIVMPANFAMKSSRQKGDLERLFVQRSKCIFLLDSGKDTWGRDVEAAEMMISNHKPALILVGDKSDGVHASRFRIFKEIHPANVIGSPHYAVGMHVHKNIRGMVKCLRRILAKKIEMTEKTEDGGTNYYCRFCGSLICRSNITWIKEG
ncbi:MAG: hypothetical protein Q8L57_02630 [bacterium]|nr:hypothetical protein [bacterium]